MRDAARWPFLLAAVLVWGLALRPGPAAAQAAAPSEAALVEALRAAEARHGSQAPELAGPLSALERHYTASGRLPQALPLAQRLLPIVERAFGAEHRQVAVQLNNLAELHRQLGQFPEALALHRRSVALHEKLYGPEHEALATAVNNLGIVEQSLGRYPEALALYERALAIRERVQPADSVGIANSLHNLAEFYRQAGPPERGLPLYERSLAILEKQLGRDHPLTALVLGNLANLHVQTGRFDLALDAALRSAAIREQRLGPAHPELAYSLSTLGEVWRGLGQVAQALATMRRALAMFEQTLGPEHHLVAMALNNLAGLHDDQGRAAEALPLYQRSLRIVERQVGADHPVVANTLSNIGALHAAAGRNDEALAAHRRALGIRERGLGTRHPEVAISLNNLAVATAQTGDAAAALPLLHRAVTVAHASPAGSEVLWAAQATLSRLYADTSRPDLAVLWGKEAVNTVQVLRGHLQGLERGLQGGYLERRRRAYDQLADLLIAQGRLDEAQSVLQMLKEQELHEGLQRADPVDPRRTRIELTGLERERFARYYELRDGQAALGVERQALERRARGGPLSEADARRLKRIVDELMPVAEAAMQAFFERLERDLAAQAATGALPAGREASRLRLAVDALALSEPAAAAVGVQYLVTDERLSIVLSLPGTPPIAHQLPVGRRELHAAIARVLVQLRNPRADAAGYREGLRRLHGWLIEPIEADLKRFGARTLMLSLDDQLRLVPYAALLDGRGRHLVQDYALALYNEAARQALERPGKGAWRVAAMGLSEAVEDLPALSAVPEELRGIVGARGVGGDAYLNARFDRARLLGTLGGPGAAAGGHNVLHIASHFVMQPGLPAQSRLYLGDKSRLTLADIARDDLKFGGFELVTFSACDSARGGGRDADGREMESLGAKTQNQGAAAVMASLWKVDDASTAALMQRFYTARGQGARNKAEALRTVQLAMIDGTLRGAGPQDWRTPFHWAAFVLMGNWR